MNEQAQQAADGQGQSATALAEAPVPSSVFSVLDSPSAQPLVPTGTGALSGEFIPGHTDTGMARLVILDHPDVAPQAAQMVGEWGDLTKFASSLDVIKFGSKVETEIERFYAVMNEQAGKMEAHVFLEVANALMSGAETQDSGLAKIEKEAEEQFKRPFLVKLIAAIGLEKMAKKMDRERLPQISSFIASQFKSGGERINSWIDGIRVKTEDSCRGQIEGIRRWELAIAEGKKHEILLAATMSAGYQVLDAANAALATLPEMSRKDQIDRIGVLTQRLVFLGRLYGDAPGRMVRSKHGLNGAVTTLVNVMSSANGFFIQLRQSAFDLTQGYQTRTLQRANADLGDVSASLSRRGAQVLGEVAVAAVGMAAENAKKQAALNKSLAATTLTMVENLKAAEQAAKTQIVEATKELAEGQRLMLELRKQQNMAT